jgi:hypothetical protein
LLFVSQLEFLDGLLEPVEDVLVLWSELPPIVSLCAQPTNAIPASAISAIILFIN